MKKEGSKLDLNFFKEWMVLTKPLKSVEIVEESEQKSKIKKNHKRKQKN